MFAGPKCSSTADAAHVCAIYACMCQRRARENDFHWVNPASPPRAHFFQLHFISLCARGNGAINKNRRARRKKESERESQAERRGEEEAIREPSESTKVLFRARLANCFLFGSAGEAGKSEREKELARCGWGLWTARSSFSKPFRASVNTRAHTCVCVCDCEWVVNLFRWGENGRRRHTRHSVSRWKLHSCMCVEMRRKSLWCNLVFN